MAEDLSPEGLVELAKRLRDEAVCLDEQGKGTDSARWNDLTRQIHKLEHAADALDSQFDDDEDLDV